MEAKRFAADVPQSFELNYLFAWPDESPDPAPLVIFLHGAGERGDDLDRIRVHGPAKQATQGQQLPFALVAPLCPAGSWWTWHEESIVALLDSLLAEHPIDPDRVYLTGLSMGGYGTWDLAARHPDRFAAIVPICGSGDGWLVLRLVNTPIWTIHNEDDDVVPVRGTIRLAEAIRAAGGNVRTTINPTGGHNAWTAAYDDPELYAWLLAQHRS